MNLSNKEVTVLLEAFVTKALDEIPDRKGRC